MTITHMLRPVLVFALTIAICSIAIAQPSVKGKVTDQGTGQPIPNVNITVKGTTRGAVSNDAGVYSITIAAGDS
ncbi:MAG TPA: carboxypeptidase-like regulatory domain-containing protein, partial [Chitinophagaceae bacterium]|nr:carboxypeptidase-like regulatory domain-containing protein [Chitinophagaceae bacterium]